MAKVCAELELVDELPLWQAELIWEYGMDRAMLAIRQHPTPARARKALEAERLMREIARWAI